ncbi:MAG: helix-turn-helix domain-containing protein [Turicibacter sp.]|nr:helix-turn-helix domain-containing protein [Turicibacter sp.]
MRTNDEMIDLLAKLKEEKGLSLSELARRVGHAKSGLSRYFNKTREFPLNKVDVFAKALGVTPEYLLGFDTSKKQTDTTSLAPDANWQPALTKKDERSIQERLEEIKLGIVDGANAANDGLGLHEYSEGTQKAVLSAIEVALTAMALERKEKFTPNKHKHTKGDN